MTRATVCAIVTDGEASRLAAQGLAQRLDLPLLERPDWKQLPDAGLVLQFDADGLALRPLGPGAAGPVRVDFGSGASDHRRRFGGGKGQMIARAVGLNKGGQLQVLDATAGLGRDAFVLASLGCQMTLLERSPVVAELLADGLQRGRQQGSAELQAILARIHSQQADSQPYLRQLALERKQFDIVYLDPMFPERGKSARVKKEMAVFHALVGPDPDAATLLSLALPVARFRVVVKRPRKAPTLDQKAPTFQLEGKSSRFDIYVNAAIVTRPTLDVGQ